MLLLLKNDLGEAKVALGLRPGPLSAERANRGDKSTPFTSETTPKPPKLSRSGQIAPGLGLLGREEPRNSLEGLGSDVGLILERGER